MCDKCKKTWVAVRPMRTHDERLECPKCGHIGAHKAIEEEREK